MGIYHARALTPNPSPIGEERVAERHESRFTGKKLARLHSEFWRRRGMSHALSSKMPAPPMPPPTHMVTRP